MIKFVRFPTTFWSTIAERPDRARQELFTRYRTPVFNYILNQGYGESDADDLTQEVFLRIAREDFLRRADRSKGKFRSLVLAVTRHVILKERARQNRQKASPLGRDELDDVPWDFPPEEPEDQRFNTLWVQNLVRLALDRLLMERRPDGPRYYEALVLNQFQGLSYEDVARTLGARVSDIKNWIHYGKKKLKSHLIDHVKTYASGEAGLSEELEFVARFIKLTR
ncbi:MAG TPA: RNA polymerase sigma factor [Planctomycetota bacterium]|jgi:RNA polymerase sigma-70 factor (ECF subfamily)|nr:RNA polymerase sigma factor [Planctomycetota bacterium]